MKTHVIPWMSKEETEHLLRELKMENGTGLGTEKPVIEVSASVEPESDSPKPTADGDVSSL